MLLLLLLRLSRGGKGGDFVDVVGHEKDLAGEAVSLGDAIVGVQEHVRRPRELLVPTHEVALLLVLTDIHGK